MRNNIENTNVNEVNPVILSESTTSNLRYFILDEDGKYASATACKKVSKTEYTYVSYDQPYIFYPSQSAAEIALLKLERACYFAKLNHHFTIKSEPIKEPTYFLIKDQDNRFVDENSIFILPTDDGKGLDFWCKSYDSTINSIWKYPTREFAERVMAKLNALKQVAGFTDIEFHIEEFKREGITPAKMTVVKIPVPKGKWTLHRQLFKDIRKQYLN